MAAISSSVKDDPRDAFTLLYGLIVEDRQIRVLLGERPPSKAALQRHAAAAVERFLTLCRVVQDETDVDA